MNSIYKVTKFIKYHSKVSGSTVESSHPSFVILSSGERVNVGDDIITEILIRDYENGSTKKYHTINPDIKFRILSTFDNDCDRSGSTIRWKVPKNSTFEY